MLLSALACMARQKKMDEYRRQKTQRSSEDEEEVAKRKWTIEKQKQLNRHGMLERRCYNVVFFRFDIVTTSRQRQVLTGKQDNMVPPYQKNFHYVFKLLFSILYTFIISSMNNYYQQHLCHGNNRVMRGKLTLPRKILV